MRVYTDIMNNLAKEEFRDETKTKMSDCPNLMLYFENKYNNPQRFIDHIDDMKSYYGCPEEISEKEFEKKYKEEISIGKWNVIFTDKEKIKNNPELISWANKYKANIVDLEDLEKIPDHYRGYKYIRCLMDKNINKNIFDLFSCCCLNHICCEFKFI